MTYATIFIKENIIICIINYVVISIICKIDILYYKKQIT